MRRYGLMRLLFDKAGEGNNGGAGGSGEGLLNGSAAGGSGTTPPPPANNNGGQGDGNGSGQGAGTSSWISALPKELQEDASIKKFPDVATLAKSYVNAQRLIGANKIVIPDQHATDEDWKNVYNKLGLPETVDKYEVKFGDSATIDKKFVDDFKALAHKSGILPKQAQALADWFTTTNINAEKELATSRATHLEKEIAGLKSEWGQAFDAKLQHANNALRNFADKDTLDYMEKTGLNNDVRLVKMLSAMGEQLYKEGKIPEGSTSNRLTPEEAMKSARAIIADTKHPYHIKGHPNHAAAVSEVAELFKQATNKS